MGCRQEGNARGAGFTSGTHAQMASKKKPRNSWKKQSSEILAAFFSSEDQDRGTGKSIKTRRKTTARTHKTFSGGGRGIFNLAQSCWFNSLLQALTGTPFSDLIVRVGPGGGAFLDELRTTFHALVPQRSALRPIAAPELLLTICNSCSREDFSGYTQTCPSGLLQLLLAEDRGDGKLARQLFLHAGALIGNTFRHVDECLQYCTNPNCTRYSVDSQTKRREIRQLIASTDIYRGGESQLQRIGIRSR